MTTYFVKTAHHYAPYDDYFTLAELSGYPLIKLQDIPVDAPNDTFIITPLNGEWMHGVNTMGRVILHDLEWRRERPYIPGVTEIWASNPEYARRINAKYVLLGSHPDFAQCVETEKIYDACHLSYVTPRRQAVYDEFVRLGGTLAPNAWGDERNRILCQSRCMLYVAQSDDFPALAPLRAAIAAAYKLPIIAELGWDSGGIQEFTIPVGYPRIAEITRQHFQDWYMGRELWRRGEGLYRHLCIENTFRKCIEAAL